MLGVRKGRGLAGEWDKGQESVMGRLWVMGTGISFLFLKKIYFIEV